MSEGSAGRRQFLRAVGAAGAVAVAGCASGGFEDTTTRSSTETSTTTTTERTTATTTEQTTTTDRMTVADVRDRRANLTEKEKRERYQAGIPGAKYRGLADYNLDIQRVREENDTRRAQLIDITATVGDQYNDWVRGNHMVMAAIHHLDWMGWENDNIVNIVTRYNSAPGEEVTINYGTGNGGRNLDGAIARDSGSGPQTYIEDIPDSELMNGSQNNNLVTDIQTWADSMENNNWGPDNYEALRSTMQSIIPGFKGPSVHADRDSRDIGLVLDSAALTYIGNHYNDSAAAVTEVSKAMLEIELATEPVRNEGRYVGVTAGNDRLEVDAIYAEEEGKAKLREPIDLGQTAG